MPQDAVPDPGWQRGPNRELAALVSRARLALSGAPTQADMAARCGVTRWWWMRLEHGDISARHSIDVLQRAADELQLDNADREYLLGLAGHAHPNSAHDWPEVSQAVSATCDWIPAPVYVSDAAFSIVYANAAMRWWFPWIADYEAAGIPPNIVTWTVLDERAKHDLVPWESWAGRMVAQLKTASVRYPHHQQLARVIGAVLDDPDGARMWDEHGAYQHPDGERRQMRIAFHDDRVIDIEMHALHPMAVPDARVMSLVPCHARDRLRILGALHDKLVDDPDGQDAPR